MKQSWKKQVRRIVCILLCIAMLPLVNAAASDYAGAYAKLTELAKLGEAATIQDPEVGQWTSYYYYTNSTEESFAIQYQDVANPELEDYLIISLDQYYSKWSGRQLTMFLDTRPEYNEAYIVRGTDSDYQETGAIDQYGNYFGEADIFLDYNSSSLDGIDIYNLDTVVSEAKFREDFLRDFRRLLERLDSWLRSQSGGYSMKDIFPNISPMEYHTVGDSWVSRQETCTEDGERSYRCASCGAVFTESIPAHHSWTLLQEIVPATDQHGSGQFICLGCGERKTDALCVSGFFSDMPAFDNWAHPGIDWAVYYGITNGTGVDKFSPGSTCTRGQVVTFLWRAAGSPEPENGSVPFTDVQPGAYYEEAVAWAVENKITSGTSATTFSPDSGCTRGQVVTFLWRAAGSPEPTSTANDFADVRLGQYYTDAVLWAVENDVTKGTSATTFSPDSTCTRAQIVTFLYRALAE